MKLFKAERETSFQEQVMMELLLGMGDTEEDPLDYLMDECRGSVKAFLEDALRAECDMFLGFGRYERAIGRAESRNGVTWRVCSDCLRTSGYQGQGEARSRRS